MNKLFLNKKQLIRLLIVAGLIVIIDQITKIIILKTVPFGDQISVINGFFNISHVHNKGGAFGILAGQSLMIRKLVFLILSGAATVFVLWLYKNIPDTHPMLANSLALITGGAIGNLIDRVRFGWVVDFLDCYIGTYHWPSFNVADSAICVGVAIFAWHILFNKLPEEQSFI